VAAWVVGGVVVGGLVACVVVTSVVADVVAGAAPDRVVFAAFVAPVFLLLDPPVAAEMTEIKTMRATIGSTTKLRKRCFLRGGGGGCGGPHAWGGCGGPHPWGGCGGPHPWGGGCGGPQFGGGSVMSIPPVWTARGHARGSNAIPMRLIIPVKTISRHGNLFELCAASQFVLMAQANRRDGSQAT
jgi:hypothetical protein